MKKITITSAILISGMMGFSAAAQTSQNDAALKALFDQANYWHEKAHNDRASESLNKVLMVDPNNTQALYLMSLWAQQNGNLQEASQWRARLTKQIPIVRCYRRSTMPNSLSKCRPDRSRWLGNKPVAEIFLPRWRPGILCLVAILLPWSGGRVLPD